MGFQQFPIIESDYSEALLVLPYGAPVKKTEAIRRYLELTKNKDNVELRAVESQYDRGRKVFSSQSDVFTSGGTSTEK